MIFWFAAAFAADPWSGTVGVSTSLVAGPRNAGADGRTLDGAYEVPATFNPTMTFGLRLGAAWTRDGHQLSLLWGAWRDQGLSDTARDGRPTGNSGTSTGVDTSNPVLAWAWQDALPARRADLSVSARYAIPLSRDALVCNPSAGGLGATLGLGGALGPKTPATLAVSASGDRALYLHAAAPRGACGVGTLTTSTLSGPVTAEAGPGYADVPNVAWTFEQRLTLTGWHAVFGLSPKIRAHASYGRAVSTASVGLRQRLDRADGPARAETLAGDVIVGRAAVPTVLSVPWSVTGGYRFPVMRHDELVAALALTAALSNQLPTLLFDPAARLAALPSTTSATVSLTSTF